MNRIPLLRTRTAGRTRRLFPSSSRAHTGRCTSVLLCCRLHYERNYSYPLIVWLHGPDNNELQLKQIMPLISIRNYVGVAPRRRPSAIMMTEHCVVSVGSQMNTMSLWLKNAFGNVWTVHASDSTLCPKRVFLAGLECGGTMAIRLALRNPHMFAAALSFGGPFPSGLWAPLARLQLARRMPLFFATTSESMLYPRRACAKICDSLIARRAFRSYSAVSRRRRSNRSDALGHGPVDYGTHLGCPKQFFGQHAGTLASMGPLAGAVRDAFAAELGLPPTAVPWQSSPHARRRARGGARDRGRAPPARRPATSSCSHRRRSAKSKSPPAARLQRCPRSETR